MKIGGRANYVFFCLGEKEALAAAYQRELAKRDICNLILQDFSRAEKQDLESREENAAKKKPRIPQCSE